MIRTDEADPFLAQLHTRTNREKVGKDSTSTQALSKCRAMLLVTFAFMNVVILLASIALKYHSQSSLQGFRTSTATNPYDYTPVTTPTEFEYLYHETHDLSNPFTGKPRPEFEDAWDELMTHLWIEVTEDELRAANKTSIKLKGGGYLAYLGVFHELHCLRRVINFRHQEHYPHLAEKGEFKEEHFDHCIEVLRQAIMCRSDTSLNTFDLLEKGTKPLGHADQVHKCVKFENIDAWARTRFAGKRPEWHLENNRLVAGPQELL